MKNFDRGAPEQDELEDIDRSERAQLRERLVRDTERFLATGGRITVCPSGDGRDPTAPLPFVINFNLLS